MSISLITPPASEPITLADAKAQLGFGPMQDSDRAASQILNDKLRAFIIAARQDCENYTNRVFITQHWLLQLGSFPGFSASYERGGYPAIDLPKPPLQSIDSFKYVDTSGVVQTLALDSTYGTNPANPLYGYQMERGSETQNGMLYPPFARPWPPARMVPNNVLVQFRCGYGGPIVATMTQGSALLTVANGVTFNPDDAPQLSGDTGLPVSIPGAGAAGAVLNTFIASVDGSGNATLAAPAATAVSGVAAWAGVPVPAAITTAIKLLVEFYYEHGGCEDVPMPRVIRALLEPYRNMVA